MIVISDELADELCSAQRLLAGALGGEARLRTPVERDCVACRVRHDSARACLQADLDKALCSRIPAAGIGDVPVRQEREMPRAVTPGTVPARSSRIRSQEPVYGEAK